MDKLKAIETFVACVEEGSIAGAARRLGLTPAAASQALAKLEAALSARLILRTTRHLAMTDAGRAYYAAVRPLPGLVEMADAAAGAVGGSVAGKLRIACTAAFGRHVIAPALPAFLRAYPRIEPELLMTDDVGDRLAQEVHVSIRFPEQLEPSLIARRLAAVPMLICAAPSYLEARGVPARPEDLADHDCLLYRFATDGRLLPWTFRRKGTLFQPPLKAAGIANDIDSLAVLAMAGLGITRLGAFIAEPLIAAGKLVSLFGPGSRTPAEEGHAPFEFYGCYLDRNADSPKIRAFLDYLARDLAPRWNGFA